jgi:endoglucanase
MPPTVPPCLRKPVATATASTSAQPATARSIVPPLHTRGSQIVDAAGARVVLQGVNWFGFETSNQVVQGLWTRDYRSMLAQIRALGFNTIRLPFSLQALHSNTINGVDFSDGKNAALQGVTPLEAMKIIVRQAARDHLMVLLDNHSDADNGYTEPLWYGNGYSQREWIETWRMLARTFANQPNVIGADLKNEPHGDATWGGGGPADWHAAAQRAGNAIQAIAPHWLIVVEGIGGNTPGQKVDAHWWGGNLEGVRYAPVRLSRPDQLVYSAHEYGPSVYEQPWFSSPNMAALLRQRWEDEFGFIAQQGIAPVLIGEFGGPQVGLDTVGGRWQRQFLDYLSSSYLSWTYWSLNPDSSGTGGILNNDWSTVDQAKLAVLHQAIAHQPITYVGSGSGTARPGRLTDPRTGPLRPSERPQTLGVVVLERHPLGACPRRVGRERRLGDPDRVLPGREEGEPIAVPVRERIVVGMRSDQQLQPRRCGDDLDRPVEVVVVRARIERARLSGLGMSGRPFAGQHRVIDVQAGELLPVQLQPVLLNRARDHQVQEVGGRRLRYADRHPVGQHDDPEVL